MIQELDPQVLRKVAEAATSGPWVLDGFAEGGCSEGCCEEYTRLSVYSVTNQGEVVASEVRAQRNADYFDAFDPPTVLALLTQLEQAKQAVERKQRALHTLDRIIERQCEAAVRATNSQDVIDTEGDWDGDWDVVWERLAELADKKREAEAQVARVRGFLEYRKEHSALARHGLRALDGEPNA